jgi:hypothetical protein
LAHRNIKNVSEDVRYLAWVGLVDLREAEKKVSARVSPRTWDTRAQGMPSQLAISAWLAILPASRRAFHSIAFFRSSVTLGDFGSLGGFGSPKRKGRA